MLVQLFLSYIRIQITTAPFPINLIILVYYHTGHYVRYILSMRFSNRSVDYVCWSKLSSTVCEHHQQANYYVS